MGSYSIETKHFQEVRSLSLPSKLNHINQRIEQELKKLGTKEEASTSASESIIIGVTGLAKLYGCINQALSLPMTQQALSLRQHEKHVGELLKGCSSLLNVCTSIKEVVSKQGLITKEIETSLSDTKERSKFGCNVSKYNSTRKEVIRDVKDVIMSLNQINDEVLGKDQDCHLSTVIKSLKCVSIINLSVYESLMCFMSLPMSKSKRSFFAKLMNKGKGKGVVGNEISDVDVALHELNSEKGATNEKVCVSSLGKLKALVNVLDKFENGLENMHKELSQTKVCLMNILSF
ncbi:putative methyl-accepting chemotaxis protein YoaH [Bienertia sinuspersici]